MTSSAKQSSTQSEAGSTTSKIYSKGWTNAQTRDRNARRRRRKDVQEVGEERLEGRKRRRLSLSADRCENQELSDWRGATLARVRILIKQADPEAVEEWKWRGVPVWSHAGIICTGETYKNVVKMTFARGAALADPSGLFNSSLEGNTRRAIDFHEGDKIDEKALQALIRVAVALNTSVLRATARPVRSQKRPKSR
jgi:hypothetical protein